MSLTTRQKIETAVIAVIVFFILGLFIMCNKTKDHYAEPVSTEVSDEIIQYAGTNIPSDVDTTEWEVDKNFVMPDFSAARMITTPSRVGMYISDVHSHLSDTAWLNAKIQYLKREGFNRLMIYSIDNATYLTGSNATKLRNFTSNLHANGIKMDIVFSKAATCTTTINTYYNGCSSSQKPDGIRWEKEYYQQTGGFLGFKAELPVAYNWAKSKSPQLDVSYYMPWLSNDCTWRYQFTELLKYNDYLEFHMYRIVPQWSYVRTRMDSAGAAWKAMIQAGLKPTGSKMRAGIIASAEDPKFGSSNTFSGIWFQTHTINDFWNAVLAQHNTNLLVNENYVDIRYIDVFSCKYFQKARP